jgi:archaellum component FlaC
MPSKQKNSEVPFLLKAVIVFAGSSLLMLSLAGCARSGDEAATDASPSASPATVDSGEQADSTEKAEFENEIQSELESMRDNVDGMQEKLNAMGNNVSDELRTVVTGFNREMSEFAGTFTSFQQAADEGWESQRDTIRSALDELKTAFANMTDEVDQAYEDFSAGGGDAAGISPAADVSPLAQSPAASVDAE